MVKRLTLVLAGTAVTAIRKLAARLRDVQDIERDLASAARTMEDGALAGKRVLVTGSTRGIGRALATSLARHGASVVVHGRGEDDVQRAVDAIAQTAETTDRVRGIAVDLGSAGAGRDLVERACREIGGLDVVINNAAIHDPIRKPIWATGSEEMLRLLMVNCLAAFDVAVAAGRAMMAQGVAGRIVNISSGAADSRHVSGSGIASYGISKIGLEGVSAYLAAEAHTVTVTTLRPDAIATDMVSALYPMEQRWQMLLPDSVVPAVVHLVCAPREEVHGKVFDQRALIRMLAGAAPSIQTAAP